MKYKITSKGVQNASINLPASKSISNRALIIQALSLKPSELLNISDCEDTKAIINAFESNSTTIDVGAAGTAMRFLTAYFSIIPGVKTLTGSERMKNRPIKALVDALNSLGGEIEYLEKEGYPPLKIHGHSFKANNIEIAGDISSQYISAILMISPLKFGGMTINIKPPIYSESYINLTIQIMKEFGVNVKRKDNSFIVPYMDYKPIKFLVENDWSAASYWYQIVAISQSAEIELVGLFKDSYQGDSKIVEVFESLGVFTEFIEGGVRLKKGTINLKKMFYDFSNIPDTAQTFVVTCCALNVPFLFFGLKTLRIKETDRIKALRIELIKLGYELIIREEEDIIEWDGQKVAPEKQPIIETYHDHRMAMSFAPLSLIFKDIVIEDPEVVNKSYPSFWDDLKKCGFKIERLD